MTDTAKLDLRSMSITDDQKAKLKQLFPEVFNEDRIDYDKLKQTLGEDIDTGEERFGMTWPGKSDCFKVIQTPSIGTLKPAKDESINWDTTENLFIEGDNLEVLKLLQGAYYGKVKMIYIDPPYNTGKEFIYPDNFTESLETYLTYTGQKDGEGQKFTTNAETSGRYHSKWLNMMYPRLFLAKNLLREDGAIFVSIDDNEAKNLRTIMDDIFGEENFISQIVWKKKTGAGSGISHVFDEHEYILVYGRNRQLTPQWRISSEDDGNFKNPDNDERGPWESCAFTAPSKNRNPNQLFMIEVYLDQHEPNFPQIDAEGNEMYDSFVYGNNYVILRHVSDEDNTNFSDYDDNIKRARFIRRWAYAKQNIKQIFEQRRVYFNNGNVPRFKKFESEYEGKALRSIYFDDFSTQQGTESLRSFFGESIVEYPKPVALLKHFILGSTNKDDIILDFFSGSCSTAQAILELNINHKSQRNFIMIQLPESCESNFEAVKAGFKTISDIGKERIRRVIKKIMDEQIAKNKEVEGKLPGMVEEKTKIDLGFRVFKLNKSNFNLWDGTVDESGDISGQIELFIDHIDPDASDEDILYEILLKTRFPLTTKIDQLQLAGQKVYSVADKALLICLERKLTKEVITEMARLQPARVVCLDAGFADNDQLKTNAVQIMKSHNVEDFRTV